MKKFFKYFIALLLIAITIYIIFALFFAYSFSHGGRRSECFDNTSILDSLKLTDKEFYTLGKYRIYPSQKVVLEYNDSCTPCYVDTLACFDSTTLVFYGNGFDFKEHLDKDIDYNSFKVLDYSIEDYSQPICKDKNFIYSRLVDSKIDVSNLISHNDWVYSSNKDSMYYFSKENRQLFTIDIYGKGLHLRSLKYISDGCFYNEDGLYRLQRQYNYKDERNIWFNALVKIEDSRGRKIEPIVNQFYFIYGSSIYVKEDNSKWDKIEFQKLDLNASQLKEFILSDYNRAFILTDGKKTYISPEKYRSRINTSSIPAWKQLSDDNQYFHYDKKKNTLYYALNHNSVSGESKSMIGALMNIGSNFWIINFSGYEEDKGQMISLDKVMINTANGYEELDTDNYKYIGDGLYIYKGVLYENLCREVPNYKDLDLDSLQAFCHNAIATKCFTDGKVLFYHSKEHGYPDIILRNVDFSTLKVVTKRMLVDKNNIYNGGVQIPIDSLGVKVKVY